jgi:hypothetical protein
VYYRILAHVEALEELTRKSCHMHGSFEHPADGVLKLNRKLPTGIDAGDVQIGICRRHAGVDALGKQRDANELKNTERAYHAELDALNVPPLEIAVLLATPTLDVAHVSRRLRLAACILFANNRGVTARILIDILEQHGREDLIHLEPA